MNRRTILWLGLSFLGVPSATRAQRDPASAALGAGEPPLGEILRRLGYTIDVGVEEVAAPRFVRAAPGPVRHRPIAAYGLLKECAGGWYQPSDSQPRRHDLWTVEASHNKQMEPPLRPGSRDEFDPGESAFGLWVATQGFPGEVIYTEDALQASIARFPASDRHKAHIYAARKNGRPVPNTYLIGWEYSTNNDNQDVVTLVSNVRPVTAAR